MTTGMRENFFWHKVHSLTGIVPIGFYMVQHLTLNTFSLAGPSKFNGVIGFFAGFPQHVLLGMEIAAIWLPLLFHAIYGIFIVARASDNYSQAAYKFRENRYFRLQRWSGIVAFFFLISHVLTTTVQAKAKGHAAIQYDAWHQLLTGNGYIVFVLYAIGVTACSYHLAYGIWNFCIRWGITINEKAQMTMGKVSASVFVALTFLGIGALYGFINPVFSSGEQSSEAYRSSAAPLQPSSANLNK
jgi:succinate dehydrogenase / fumarate reductase cytochrome b subunit